jgi:hypothetical protein
MALSCSTHGRNGNYVQMSVEKQERKMSSSGMLRLVALARSDVSLERIASIIRVTRIDELGTLAVTSNRRMLRRNIVVCHMSYFQQYT